MAEKFFRHSVARSVCAIDSHGSRRGLPSFAAPQLLLALLAFLNFSLHAATLPGDWRRAMTVMLPPAAPLGVPVELEVIFEVSA